MSGFSQRLFDDSHAESLRVSRGSGKQTIRRKLWSLCRFLAFNHPSRYSSPLPLNSGRSLELCLQSQHLHLAGGGNDAGPDQQGAAFGIGEHIGLGLDLGDQGGLEGGRVAGRTLAVGDPQETLAGTAFVVGVGGVMSGYLLRPLIVLMPVDYIQVLL